MRSAPYHGHRGAVIRAIRTQSMSELLYKDLSYGLVGCCPKVQNTLGSGHKESVYQKSLAIELTKANIKFEEQKTLNILYDKKKVGVYRPDFIIENKIVVELKAVEFIPKDYERQLIYYLKGTDYKLGYLINFGAPSLYAKRIIWTN